MKTPALYVQNLNNHIITTDMLANCLYSSNKRAKNWRDKEREYRYKKLRDPHWCDKHDNEAKAKEKKEGYYKQKEIMLSILKPACIHRELTGYPIFDGVELKEHPLYNYYLFYSLDTHSFHLPIDSFRLNAYPALEIIDIDKLNTKGDDTHALISNQFVDKLIQLISTNDYIIMS